MLFITKRSYIDFLTDTVTKNKGQSIERVVFPTIKSLQKIFQTYMNSLNKPPN